MSRADECYIASDKKTAWVKRNGNLLGGLHWNLKDLLTDERISEWLKKENWGESLEIKQE